MSEEMKLTKQEEAMLAKGFASVRIVAEKMQVHFSTVYRLIEQNKVRGIKAGVKQYVEIKSVVEYLGPEAAKLLGMLPSAKKS